MSSKDYQQDRDIELLENWEAKLEKEFSPTGHIKGLEVQANNLIINFESEVPGQFQLTTGAPIRMVGELLAAQDRLTEKRVRKEVLTNLAKEAMLPVAYKGNPNGFPYREYVQLTEWGGIRPIWEDNLNGCLNVCIDEDELPKLEPLLNKFNLKIYYNVEGKAVPICETEPNPPQP